MTALRQNGCQITERHANVWRNFEDKSQIAGLGSKLRVVLSIVMSYPALLVRHASSARQDLIVCAYPGNIDLLALWVLAKLRGEKIALDAFLPVHDTVVGDRRLLNPRGSAARLVHAIECLSCRIADIIIVDTLAHGEYYQSEYGVKPEKVVRAYVGSEPDNFYPSSGKHADDEAGKTVVLFYGQFIPLHGIETVIEAARLCGDKQVLWRIIGTGQEAERIRRMLSAAPLENLEWIPWVNYAALRVEIERATVCLGIFGTSQKAGRVIPNKVFQIVACNKPLVTRDSSAIRELFGEHAPGLQLISPGDPVALVAAVQRALACGSFGGYCDAILDAITPKKIGSELLSGIRRSFERTKG